MATANVRKTLQVKIVRTVASGYSTPKGQKFRIPDMLSCPAAPMKPKFSSKRKKSSQIAFYAPSEIELFFYSAFRYHFT
ncbi:hypothetical protein SLE2022_137100 [Rubroshorea leprosula]